VIWGTGRRWSIYGQLFILRLLPVVLVFLFNDGFDPLRIDDQRWRLVWNLLDILYRSILFNDFYLLWMIPLIGKAPLGHEMLPEASLTSSDVFVAKRASIGLPDGLPRHAALGRIVLLELNQIYRLATSPALFELVFLNAFLDQVAVQ